MRSSSLFYAALAVSVASAQSGNPNLTAALGAQGNLSILTQLVSQNTQLLSALQGLSNVTLLAPSNQAFQGYLNSSSANQTLAADMNAILQYHVLNGTYYASNFTENSTFIHTTLTNDSYTTVTNGQVIEAFANNNTVTFYSALKQNSTVTTPNLNFTGGVIHIIDNLLSIPQNLTATAQQSNLTALSGAIQSANLGTTLGDLSDVTVFAPNNEAFQSIASVLSNASQAALSSILSYHIVNNSVLYSSDITSNTTLPTLGGGNITITLLNNSIFVNSARVVNPDVLIAPGVVHVIDGVLSPNNTSAAPNATASTAAPAFTGASSASDIPFTSGQPTPSSSVPAAGTATTGAGGGAASRTSSSSAGAWMPAKTGAVGAAALFGGAAMVVNW